MQLSEHVVRMQVDTERVQAECQVLEAGELPLPWQ